MSQEPNSHEGHEGGSSVRTYVIIALILAAITYIEFALIEYEFAFLDRTTTLVTLVVLSVLKFVLVVMFFMHLKDDDNILTGFFSSGMVIAVGTLVALSLLFTVRSLSYAQTPQEEQAELVQAIGDGEHVYQENCISCHQANGHGVVGAVPPHIGHTPYLAQATGEGVGGREYMINVVLHGLEGQIVARGEQYDGIMPPYDHLSDEEISEVLNYSVNAWGNQTILPENFQFFSPEEVAEVRSANSELSSFDVYKLRSALDIPEGPEPLTRARDLATYFNTPPPKTLDVRQINIDPGSYIDYTREPESEMADEDSSGEGPDDVMGEISDDVGSPETDTVQGIRDEDQDPLYEGETGTGEVVDGAALNNPPELPAETVAPDILLEPAQNNTSINLESPFAADGNLRQGDQQNQQNQQQPQQQNQQQDQPQGSQVTQQGGGQETQAAQTSFDWQQLGEQAYSNCTSCHQADGQGIAGAFPPLAGHLPSVYNVDGGREYIINVLLYGLQGEIQIDGQSYNGVMTAWGQLSNEEIAAVINHELTTWGNESALQNFQPLQPDEVEALRGQGLSATDVYNIRQGLNLQ